MIPLSSSGTVQSNKITNICSECGKIANPYYMTSYDDKIYCSDCYEKINKPDIKDPFKKRCYDLLLTIKNSLGNCINLLDNKFEYVTTASGVAKEKISEIENFLKEIRNEKKLEMKKYKAKCWIYISVPYEVEANNEQEAEQKAQDMFEQENLNSCIAGDSGCEVKEIK